MARKEVTPKQKQGILERLRASARGENEATTSDEARRIGVTPQAVRGWVRVDKEANPDLWIPLQKAVPEISPENISPQTEGGQAAALEAIGAGDATASESGAGPAPLPQPAVPPVPSILEDEALVWMTGNTVMGVSMRVAWMIGSRKAGVSLPFTPFERLCVLTEGERAGLRPCVPFLAPLIRKGSGSSKGAALLTAGGILIIGVISRAGEMGAVLRQEMDRMEEKRRREGNAKPKGEPPPVVVPVVRGLEELE